MRAVSWTAVSTSAQAAEELASLKAQTADNAAAAERIGAVLIDTLTVPGHSRRYLDYHELAADARAQGIDAFDKLLIHLRQRDFDVLICRDSDRFARSQALHAYIVESVIAANAKIYSLADGWVDESNYRMFIAMAGYKAAAQVDTMIKLAKDGRLKLAARGLPVAEIGIGHVVVRNDKGKALWVALRPNMERFWQDLARLVVQGYSWNAVHQHMAAHGHRHPVTNRVLLGHHLHHALLDPMVWGKSSYGGGREPRTTWPFNPHAELPPGLTPFHHPELPIPLVYPHEIITLDEQGEPIVRTALTAALIAFEQNEQRKAHKRAHPLSGLLRCGNCGGFLRYHGRPNPRSCSYRCARYERDHTACADPAIILVDVAIQQVNDFLEMLLEVDGVQAAMAKLQGQAQGQDNRLALITADIASLEKELRGLLRDRALQQSPRQVAALTEMLEDVEKRLQALDGERLLLLKRDESPAEVAQREHALDGVRNAGLLAFWRRPAMQVNQLLDSILGRKRFIVRDRQIVDAL